jgi:hypothetical protein
MRRHTSTFRLLRVVAGFQVSINGRFWVSTEARLDGAPLGRLMARAVGSDTRKDLNLLSTETKGSADHAMRDPRSLLRIGIGAYLVSFFLVAISPGTRGLGCAILALSGPFIALNVPSGTGAAQFFDGNRFGYVALFVSGLVNIAFPLAMFLKFKRYDRSFAAARIAVLVTIPFSWMVFVLLPVLPREGHVLWVSGMLLALFCEEIAAQRRASVSSRGPESSAPHSGPGAPMMPPPGVSMSRREERRRWYVSS